MGGAPAGGTAARGGNGGCGGEQYMFTGCCDAWDWSMGVQSWCSRAESECGAICPPQESPQASCGAPRFCWREPEVGTPWLDFCDGVGAWLTFAGRTKNPCSARPGGKCNTSEECVVSTDLLGPVVACTCSAGTWLCSPANGDGGT